MDVNKILALSHIYLFFLFSLFIFSSDTNFSLLIISQFLLLVRTDGKAVGKQLFDCVTGFINQKIKS